MDTYIQKYVFYLNSKKHLSYNTIESYKRDITQFFKFIDKADPPVTELSQIDCTTIENYLENLSQSGKSNATVIRTVASLKSFFSYLYNQKFILQNVILDNKMVKKEKKLPQILTDEEMDILLKQPKKNGIKGYRDKAILNILYATGIRVSELIDLKVRDVNLTDGHILCHSEEHMDKLRLIPMYPEATLSIADYLKQARPAMIRDEAENTLFINFSGQKLTRQGVWKIIKSYTESANIKKTITPHTIRHSFAAHLFEHGADLESLKELLGHSDVSSTQIYARLAKSKTNEIYKRCHPKA